MNVEFRYEQCDKIWSHFNILLHPYIWELMQKCNFEFHEYFPLFLKSQTFHMSKFYACKYEFTIRECSEKLKNLFSNWVELIKVIKVWTEQPFWTSMSDISRVTKFDLMIICLNLHLSDSLCKLYLAQYLFLFVLSSVFEVANFSPVKVWCMQVWSHI